MKILNPFERDFYVGHFQGGSHNGLYPLVLHYGEQPIEIQSDISVVTVHNRPESSMLIQQLNKNKIPFFNDYPNHPEWTNTFKIGAILASLRRVKTEYVFILDGSDVLFFQSPVEIKARFNEYGKRLMFNATMHNHPKRHIDKIRDRDWRGDFRFFNAGACFGYTQQAVRFYQLARDKLDEIDNPEGSEQLVLRHAFAEVTDAVDFDYNCTIFQTFGGTDLVPVDAKNEIYKVIGGHYHGT